jgi:peptidyl-prolyl cis-trans isomerase D
MLITRFHKLIQSKTVWYIILGIIVVSFVGFFTPTMRGRGKHTPEQAAGELFGKKVTQDEYRRAYRNAYMWQVISSGRMIPVTDKLSAALHREAWVRLAALHKVQEQKIPVTNEEIVRQIQMVPIFHDKKGAFDSSLYKIILQNLSMSSRQVEQLFREQLSLSKLLYRHTQATLISPYELTRAYHFYTDRFVLDYALLSREAVEKDVAVSQEDAKTFFEQNTESFRIPSKVRVSYVEFPVKDFLDQAEVSEETALQAYNQNKERYRVVNTNENAEVEYLPFEKVQGAITDQLREGLARRQAAAKASEFVADISPESEGEQPDFKGKAASAGLEIKTLPAFGAGDKLSGIDPTAPFRQAAFGLQNDTYSSFSDAVVGKSSVYVLSLEQRYESFLPEFDVVEDDAMEAARRQAVSKALAEQALEIKGAAAAAVAAGAGFEEAVKPFGLTVQRTDEFDLTTDLDNPYADTLIPLCLNASEGTVCDPAPVSGGVLIAFVAERKSTDIDVGLPAVRQELIQGMERIRMQQLVAGWQISLLDEANLKEQSVR